MTSGKWTPKVAVCGNCDYYAKAWVSKTKCIARCTLSGGEKVRDLAACTYYKGRVKAHA